MFDVSPVADTVNTPVVPDVLKQVPEVVGFALVLIQTPLPVTVTPPSEVTFPPRVAVDPVIDVLVGEVTVGVVAVVNETMLPLVVP